MSPTANAISEMIRTYDRSPYTHVGIDLGDESAVICRTQGELIKAGEDGGVRVDRFPAITDRELFCAPVLLDEREKVRAVERTRPLIEEDGLGDVSGFSFPKMFQCAVAVDASRPEATFTDEARDHMVHAAFAAGVSWAYTPERASFFCAEMVVEAYRAQVPTAYLAPPYPPKGLLADAVVDAAALARDVIESWAPGGCSRTMAAVVAAVTRHDPHFFGGALASVWRWLRDSGHTDDEAVVARGERPEVLPAALVTPRMLLRCDWVGEPVHQLTQPDTVGRRQTPRCTNGAHHDGCR